MTKMLGRRGMLSTAPSISRRNQRASEGSSQRSVRSIAGEGEWVMDNMSSVPRRAVKRPGVASATSQHTFGSELGEREEEDSSRERACGEGRSDPGELAQQLPQVTAEARARRLGNERYL